MKTYRICRVRCKKCGDILEHENKTYPTRAELQFCTCGSVGLDPDNLAYRIIAESRDVFEDLSQMEE